VSSATPAAGAVRHGASPPVAAALARLESEARQDPRYRNLRPDGAAFVSQLVVTRQAMTIVEIGCANGYSSIWLAQAARLTGGHLTTFDKFPERAALAKANLYSAWLTDHVTVSVGDTSLMFADAPSSIDFLFLDIWPADYEATVSNLRSRLSPHAVIVVDNIREHRDRRGAVHDSTQIGVGSYYAFLAAQPYFTTEYHDLGCGLLVTETRP
jgi:predicted O-methyltransferase YrrM